MRYSGIHHPSALGRLGGIVSFVVETALLIGLVNAGIRRVESFNGFLWSTGELVLGLTVAVVLHESGHLLVGLAVGEPVRKMRVGSGPTVVGFHVGKVAVQVCLNPLGGGAVYFSSVGGVPEQMRLASLAAGPGMNALSVAYGLALYDFGIDWLGAFVVANMICFVTSALPSTQGGGASDGMQLLRILFKPAAARTGVEGAEMTEDAHAALVRAVEEAAFAGEEEVTDEHLLRALSQDAEVGGLFASLGLIERIAPAKNAEDDESPDSHWSDTADKALHAAVRKAREVGASRTNAAAIALGLLSVECPASNLMKQCGIKEESLRKLAAAPANDEESRRRELVLSPDLELERWGTAADKVLAYAFRIAAADHAEYVGTQHIIAAVVADPACRGAQALARLGFELVSRPDPSEADSDKPKDDLILSPDAVLAVAGAIWRTGPRFPTGTAELCLGILDQSAGVGAQILTSGGVSSESLIKMLRYTDREQSAPAGCTAAVCGIWISRGVARIKGGRWLDARQDFVVAEKAASTDRQRALCWNNTAWASLMSGDPALRAEALELSRSALAATPDHPDYKGTHAFALLETGSPAEAIALLEPLAPTRPRAGDRALELCVLAMGYARVHRLDEAAKTIEAAGAADPKCPLLDRARAELETASALVT